jgi:hypothetical protein
VKELQASEQQSSQDYKSSTEGQEWKESSQERYVQRKKQKSKAYAETMMVTIQKKTAMGIEAQG